MQSHTARQRVLVRSACWVALQRSGGDRPASLQVPCRRNHRQLAWVHPACVAAFAVAPSRPPCPGLPDPVGLVKPGPWPAAWQPAATAAPLATAAPRAAPKVDEARSPEATLGALETQPPACEDALRRHGPAGLAPAEWGPMSTVIFKVPYTLSRAHGRFFFLISTYVCCGTGGCWEGMRRRACCVALA